MASVALFSAPYFSSNEVDEIDKHEIFYKSKIRVIIANYLGHHRTPMLSCAISYHPLTDRTIWPTVFSEQLPSVSSQTKGLELNFARYVNRPVNIQEEIHFADFLEPNEGTPGNIRLHLEKMAKGLIVSTGTERSIFDLLLSPEGMCTGLVVRDINPRVKAYMDFLILLVRIAEGREEFVALSQRPEIEEFDNRLEEIRHKIYRSDLPEAMKEYYLHHLRDFASLYFPRSHLPKRGDNSPVDYRKSDPLFIKLQRFAKAGNIMVTVGDIGDLEFLGTRSIAIVDASNICDYIPIDLRGRGIFHPRVIWTIPHPASTQYHSYLHEDISEAGRTTIDRCMKILFASGVRTVSQLINYKLVMQEGDRQPFDSVPKFSYSSRVVSQLTSTVHPYFIYSEELGWIGFHPKYYHFTLGRLEAATPDQVALLLGNPKIRDQVGVLVRLHEKLRPETYMAFMDVPGWKEAFEQLSKENVHPDDKHSIDQILLKVRNVGLLASFSQQFGDERLLGLHQECHPPKPTNSSPVAFPIEVS